MRWGLWSAVASVATLAGGGVGYLLNQQSGSSTPPVVQGAPSGDMLPNTQFQGMAMSPQGMPLAQGMPPVQNQPPPTVAPPPIQTSVAPEMAVVPTNDNKYLYMAAGAGLAGLFFLAGDWYRNYNGHWYRSNAYNGNWAWMDQRYVPASLMTVYPYQSYYLNTYTQRVPYTVVNRDWRTWESDRHWDRYEWYRRGRLATPTINTRQVHQEQRIVQGVRSGKLTQQEATQLQASQDNIQSMKMQARYDGVVTNYERQQIKQAQRDQRQEIRYQKHDLDRVASAAPTPSIDQRQYSQQQRINRGEQRGQLTTQETTQLRAREQQVQTMRNRAQQDGVVSRPERREIRQEQREMRREIRQEKHDRQRQ